MIEKFWSYLILFLFFSWIFESCQEKMNKENIKVIEVEEISPPKIDKDKLVEAFIYVESKGNIYAVNNKTKATGCLQILPIMVEEANRLVGYDKYRLSDRINREKSIEIFHTVMEHRNFDYDIAIACRLWNYRGGWSYYDKVKNKYNELIKED